MRDAIENRLRLLLLPLLGALVTLALGWWFFLAISPSSHLLEIAAQQRGLARQIVAAIELRRSGGGGARSLSELAHDFDHNLSTIEIACRPTGWGLLSGVGSIQNEIDTIKEAWRPLRMALSRATPSATAPVREDALAAGVDLRRFRDASDAISEELQESQASREHLMPRIVGVIAFANWILLLVGVWITNRHVAQSRRTEGMLHESHGRYESLVEATSDGIVVSDENGTIVSWNHGATVIYGYTAKEAVGSPVTMIMTEETGARFREHLTEIATRDVSHFVGMPFEVEGLRKNGDRFQLEITVAVWTGASNQKLTGAIVRDTTLRRQKEQEVVRLAEAVDQATEAIMMTTTDGRIVYVNPAFERVSGYQRDEAIGQKPSISKSGHQDAAFYRRMWETLLRGEVWSGNLVNRRKDGTLYQERAVISPVRNAEGQVINYVAVKRDITQEVALESQLRQSQKMEAIGRLAGGVAHDFNNLLTAIMGYSHLLRPKLANNSAAVHDLDEVLKAAGRAATLTRQLLAFSRQQILEPKVVNVNTIITDLDKMLRRLIGEDVDLVTHAHRDLGQTRVDPGQMEQVIVNLVVNARDAMPEGGRLTIETANVEIGAEGARPDVPPGRYVMIAVTDTGTGMTAEVRARLFEPFFTTKESGKGTGLGLSTVHGIVKQSGGDIKVYSELGRGATFKVYLPRIDVAEDARSSVVVPEAAGGNETILVVEDDDGIRYVLKRGLESLGYAVIAAESGDAAVALGGVQQRIDLLVSDVVMPRMGGPELARQMTQLRPNLKVLLISGYADRALVHQGLRTPGMAFLQKPFTPQTLASKVREILDQPLEKAA